MVFKHTTYRCGKCRAWYNTYREAETCEIGHAGQEATSEALIEIHEISQKAITAFTGDGMRLEDEAQP